MDTSPPEDSKNQSREQTTNSPTPSPGVVQEDHTLLKNTNLTEQTNDDLNGAAPKSPDGGPLVTDIDAGTVEVDPIQIVEEMKGIVDETNKEVGVVLAGIAANSNTEAGKDIEQSKDVTGEVVSKVGSEHADNLQQTDVSRLELNSGNNAFTGTDLLGNISFVQENKTVETDTEIRKQTEIEQPGPIYASTDMTEGLEIGKSETPDEEPHPVANEGALFSSKDEEEEKMAAGEQDLQDKSLDMAETSGIDSMTNSVPSLPDDASSSGPHTPKEDEQFLKDDPEEQERVIPESAEKSFSTPLVETSPQVMIEKSAGVVTNEDLPKDLLISEDNTITDANFIPIDKSVETTETSTLVESDESLAASNLPLERDMTDISEDASSAIAASGDIQSQLQPTGTDDAFLTNVGGSNELRTEDIAVTDNLVTMAKDNGHDRVAASSSTPEVAEPVSVLDVLPEPIPVKSTPTVPQVLVTSEKSSDSLFADVGEQSTAGQEPKDNTNQDTSPVEKVFPEVFPDPITIKSTPTDTRSDEEYKGVTKQITEPTPSRDGRDEVLDYGSYSTQSMEAPLIRESRGKKEQVTVDKAAAVIPASTYFEEPGSSLQDDRAPLVKSRGAQTYGTSVDDGSSVDEPSETSGLFLRIRNLVYAYCNIL